MTTARLAPAHGLVLLAAIAGCSDSHGRDADASSDLRDSSLLLTHDSSGPIRDGAVPIDVPAPMHDAGPRGACEADDATPAICPDGLCDGLPTWHWNGDDCFWIDCGACVGEDCDRSFLSEEQCLAAHASCEPSLCRRTGGTWMFWAEECTHWRCGTPGPIDCIVGRPVCDCGPSSAFDETLGCVRTDCSPRPPRTDEQLCVSSGGSWEPICCHTTCGEPCSDPCAADACNCGPGRIFEAARGCVASARCYERLAGESCLPRARCAEGTLCCDQCGGAGCSGRPTCVAPTCDTVPGTDACGNGGVAP